MRAWVISDIHSMQDQLTVPDNIDCVICSGDMTHTKSRQLNHNEILDFYDWVDNLKLTFICCPGNHDTALESKALREQSPQRMHILINESMYFMGSKFYGSPYTPTFGQNWAFNCNRGKIDKHWKEIPDNLDFLITHGPPKGILDNTWQTQSLVEMAGDRALLRYIKKQKPKHHIFGHMHDEEDIPNFGCFTRGDTKFINAACANLHSNKLIHNGFIIDYEKNKN